ncbi:MAG: universal stress protein [Woeseiaceae bacterium]|nr:universal stress protein [Woeseiaceae bacterium]
MSDIVLAIIELDTFPNDVARRAAWIAKRYGYDLELMFSDPTLGVLRDSYLVSSQAQQIAENIREAQEKILQDLADSIAASGLTIATSVSHEKPAADAIVARAIEIEPKFVVKGTNFHSPAERATFTYTDWRLIRRLTVPLWLVKPQDIKEQPVIIAAVDPAHRHDDSDTLDQVIVDAAKALAENTDGHMHLLHTYERLVEIGRHAMLTFKPVKLPIDELEENIREMHREKLDALAKRNGIPRDDVHQLPGRTHEILPMFARAQGADVVVMGALQRGAMKRRVLGSTAEKVLDHLPCDILITRN